MPLKVHIAFGFTDNPFGGGNQFLKSLRNYFRSINVYEENFYSADAVLFNSHQQIRKVAAIKLKHPEKVFVHRIDGPMKVYNNPADRRDNIVFAANKSLADATVFQSDWSRRTNHELKLPVKNFETVVRNSVDGKVFDAEGRIQFSISRKVRLIAASWSANWNKGFETYKWLDENLDFTKYEMTFVGNSPVKFEKMEHLPPLAGNRLAEKFKQSDIFIFASPVEACSNLLLEALHCGLPAVAPNSSSNPEIIEKGGELFNEPSEIPRLLEKIVKNYSSYSDSIEVQPVEDIGKIYYDFIKKVYADIKQIPHKKFAGIDYLHLTAQIFLWKAINKINNAFKISYSK